MTTAMQQQRTEMVVAAVNHSDQLSPSSRGRSRLLVPSPARSFKSLACNYPPAGEQEAVKGTDRQEVEGGRGGIVGKGRSSDWQRRQSAHNGRN